MADEMNTSDPTQPNTEGVSTPPDNGNVSDTGTSADTDNSADIQAAQQGQPQSDPAAQPQGPQTPQAAEPGQPGQPSTQTPPAQATKPEVHPAVKRASMLNEIATALAGGPSYKLTIDPNTGTSTRTQVPLSKGQIGIAIALEALSGGLAGLGAKGTNATGQAAGMGLQQGEKIAQQKQQAQQQQDQQTNADFAHHAQTLETNMRMYNGALTAGRMTQQQNTDYVGQFKPMADKLMNDYPAAVKGLATEQELQQHHITKDTAIPYAVVPRLDPKSGEQVKNSLGVPMSDIQYLVVDPKFKADDLLTPEDRATFARYGMQGFVKSDGSPTDLPQSLPMKLGMLNNLKSQIGSLQLAEHDLGDYYSAQGNKASNASTQAPELKDPEIQKIADTTADKYDVDKNLVRAVIQQESGGKSNAKSVKGALGVMQLMPGTAKDMGVTNPLDPAQNIEGGVKYLSQLLKNNHGDVTKALQQYNAGPNGNPDNAETKGYVASITKAIGLGEGGNENAPQAPDLAAAVKKDPTLVKTLGSFQAILNSTASKDKYGAPSYGKAISQMAESDPSGAGKIAALYGGKAAMQTHDQQMTMQREQAELDQKDAAAVKKAGEINANKQAADQQSSNQMQALITPPKGFAFTPDMDGASSDTLKQKLQTQGVQVPSNFESLYAVANGDVPLTSYASRVWAKGAPSEMDQQTATSYIRKFINPSFTADTFNNIANERKKLNDGDTKQGSTLLNAGTAATHLDLLRQANQALANNDLPALNKLANSLGVATGKTPALVFGSIADKAADEVSKVAMGGGAPYKEQVLSTRSQLSPNASPQQNEQVINAMTSLMAGRLRVLDSFAQQHARQHIQLDPEVTQLLQKNGNETPWSMLPGQRSGETPVIQNGQLLGFTKPGAKGMRPVQAPQAPQAPEQPNQQQMAQAQ